MHIVIIVRDSLLMSDLNGFELSRRALMRGIVITSAGVAAGGSLLADHAVHEAIERKYSISGEFSLKLRK